MAIRNPSKDKLKSNSVLKEQLTKPCMLEDCDNTISIYDGPGSNVLCREHQLECVEYGGMGKPERPWTCLLYTSPSPRDGLLSRMPSSA